MKAHSVKPFIVFHLSVGIRLALRKFAPILAVAFAAYYILRPELFNTIFAALLERGSILMGLVSSILSLSVSAMAAPRICLGLNGWIRHLPARGLTHRRLAGVAITVAQTPLLLVLAILALIAFAVFQVSPFLYLLGLPILGLASGLCVLPVKRNVFSKPLTFAACVLSTSGHWVFLTIAVALLILADQLAGSLSSSRISRVPQGSLSSSMSNVIIFLRALRLRILFPYLPALFVLGLTHLFLSNNTLTPHQMFRAVIFGGTLSVSMFCAFIANTLAVRRPPWPWARSLPWSAKQRIVTDASLIGLFAIPILFFVMLFEIQAIWPVVVCFPPLVLFASLTMRRAFENQLGAVWQTLIVGTTTSVLVCLATLEFYCLFRNDSATHKIWSGTRETAKGKPLARNASPCSRGFPIMEPTMIHFHRVSFSYKKEAPILVGIDLEFRPGLTMLLGPNGCGKSTLLKLASGVEKPDTGQIMIDDHDLWQDEVEARRTLSYVPEQPDLTPYATIREILNLVCRLRDEPLEKGMDALEFFGLHDFASRTIRELSLGQRRRAVFAAALIGTPRYILLDEPLEGMDRKIKEDISSWIKHYVDSGAVVVIVSHTIEPFVDLTSQAVTIKDGSAILYPNVSGDSEQKLTLLDNLAKGII